MYFTLQLAIHNRLKGSKTYTTIIGSFFFFYLILDLPFQDQWDLFFFVSSGDQWFDIYNNVAGNPKWIDQSVLGRYTWCTVVSHPSLKNGFSTCWFFFIIQSHYSIYISRFFWLYSHLISAKCVQGILYFVAEDFVTDFFY